LPTSSIGYFSRQQMHSHEPSTHGLENEGSSNNQIKMEQKGKTGKQELTETNGNHSEHSNEDAN
jgi:hypothetical protein